jgi:hypothetical protein
VNCWWEKTPWCVKQSEGISRITHNLKSKSKMSHAYNFDKIFEKNGLELIELSSINKVSLDFLLY